jgi:hypothetical protein
MEDVEKDLRDGDRRQWIGKKCASVIKEAKGSEDRRIKE